MFGPERQCHGATRAVFQATPQIETEFLFVPHPPADLTASQWEAVDHCDGPMLVLAGPGSGKTRVITRRIARLIERGVDRRQILAVTFTNKAAREMAERVAALVPGGDVWVSTFHRLAARLLRRYASAVGLKPHFTILDQGDQRSLIKQVIQELDFDAQHYSPARAEHWIGQAKSRLQTAAAVAENREFSASCTDAVFGRIYERYQQRLLAANAVDFDDLLLHLCMILAENPDIRSELDERFRYVLVDEYQDTNLAQYRIVTAISHDYPNLCATGDPDQSIYGWRGAELGNILRFEADFPNAKVVRLEQNYRSTKSILQAAANLIAQNRERRNKLLHTENAPGRPVEVLGFTDERSEARGIARMIGEIAGREQRPWSDFAVFYRVNALARELELALLECGIPYQVAMGAAFYERTEIKDLLAYLRLIVNPADDLACLRVLNAPPRGIGKTTRTRLANWAAAQATSLLEAAARAEHVPDLQPRAIAALRQFAATIDRLSQHAAAGVAVVLEEVLQQTGYAAKTGSEIENSASNSIISELLQAARAFDEQYPGDDALERFLETASLVSDADSIDERGGTVTLMTLHAAKGLEFPVVLIMAVEHGLLPHQRAVDSGEPREYEEERRLLFVGMTRAEHQLFLTQTLVRTLHGKRQTTIPSLFLREIGVEATQFEPPDLAAPPNDPAAPTPLDDFDDAPFDEFDDAAAPAAATRWKTAPRRQNPQPARPAAAFAPGDRPRLTTAAELLNGTRTPVEIPGSFRVGMSVRHPRLGVGQVIEAAGSGKWRTLKVQFAEGDPHTFIEHKCPLQPVGL